MSVKFGSSDSSMAASSGRLGRSFIQSTALPSKISATGRTYHAYTLYTGAALASVPLASYFKGSLNGGSQWGKWNGYICWHACWLC